MGPVWLEAGGGVGIQRLVVIEPEAVEEPAPVGLAIAGGYFLAGRLLAPVGAMAATARKIGAESVADRLSVANPRVIVAVCFAVTVTVQAEVALLFVAAGIGGRPVLRDPVSR